MEGKELKLIGLLGWELGFVMLSYKRKRTNAQKCYVKKKCDCPLGKCKSKAKLT